MFINLFRKYNVNGEFSEMLFFTQFPELSQIKSLNCDNRFLYKPPKFEYDASLKFLSTLSMAYQYFNILTQNPYQHIQFNPNEHLAYQYLQNVEYKSHPQSFTTQFKIQFDMNLFRIVYENLSNYEKIKTFYFNLKQNLSISRNLFLSTEEEKREALLRAAYGIIYSKFANYSPNYLNLAKEIFYFNPTNSFPIEKKWKIGYFNCIENIIKKIDLANYLVDVDVVTQEKQQITAWNIFLFIEAYLDNFLGNELNPERTQVQTNLNIMKSTRILSYIFNSLLSRAILTSTNLNKVMNEN